MSELCVFPEPALANERMFVGVDNETHLIRPAVVAPPMVCVSIAHDVNHADVIHRKDPACERTIRELIKYALDGDIFLVGQNIPFDLAVWINEWPDLMEPVFEMFERGRILDTKTRQKFLDIANGILNGFKNAATGVFTKYKYNLQQLAQRHDYPIDLDKDTWRLRYRELDDVPVAQWPQEAVDYSAHDARSTLWVALKQEESDPRYLGNQFERMRAAWGLYLASAWGVRMDPSMVARHRANTEARLAKFEQLLFAEGLLARGKKKGVPVIQKKVKLAQERAFRVNPDGPKTDGGKPSLAVDSIDHYKNDPVIEAFIEYSNAERVMGHVRELEAGVVYPVHTNFDELKETGRTGSDHPPIQNRAVKQIYLCPNSRFDTVMHDVSDQKNGKPWKPWCHTCDCAPLITGDRECFVPRNGCVFIDADVPGLELRTVAQCCLWSVGKSRLAEVLNAGGDPHAMVAASILGIPLEEVLKRKKNPNDMEIFNARQTGKVGNFGLPAGLGWKTLVEQARVKYDVILTEQQAKDLIVAWKATWPEFIDYFKYCKNVCGESGHGMVIQFKAERYRGLTPYTVACNSYFQGLGADATLAALWAVQKECYIGNGPLRGSRLVNYVHDQYIVETPEEGAHEAAMHLEKVVLDAANVWLPDVPIKEMAPMLVRRWSKSAMAIRDVNGRLIPWEFDQSGVSDEQYAEWWQKYVVEPSLAKAAA